MRSTKRSLASKSLPGARESSAGDDFHLLWAARKALDLLIPGGDLKALAIEGPSPDESIQVDPGGDQLLGIDLTEYYGGEILAEADLVVFSQLKYSTRRANRPWTSAQLARGKGAGSAGSIIHRFAQTFTAYHGKLGRETLLQRGRLKLVSNRPLSQSLAGAIKEVRTILEGGVQKVARSYLLGKLSVKARAEIDKLNKASSLQSTQFTDFLRVLDLTDCGTASRFEQDAELIRALGSHGWPEVSGQYSALKILILQRMMPEARNLPPLKADDIVPAFKIPSVHSAFPAKARFIPLENPIERHQLNDIALAIVGQRSGPICLHGGAACGKTTFVRLLQRYLPKSTVVVVFDCYGAGSHSDPAEIRHTHRRAILQITNELAAQTGGPLLLPSYDQPEELLQLFKRRLSISVDLLRKKSRQALVVIVIDAADNSVVAANQFHQKSFVSDLVRCELPNGCRLVVTFRTHRRDLLDLPTSAIGYELQYFNPSESELSLRRFFPGASGQQIKEFHTLSNGNPRIQGYALSRQKAGIERVLAALRPSGKTVEGIIDQQIGEASKKLGDEKAVENICRAIVVLPRPVPVAYAADLAKVNPDAVRDFCIDMWPGLRMENDAISFSDEDFETYLRDRFVGDDNLVVDLASLLLAHSQEDSYAAVHLGDVLYKAGSHKELREIVLEDKLLDGVKDHLQRQDTFLRRVQLALRASSDLKDRVDLFKLVLVAAQAAKIDETVRGLIIENTDLAVKYGDPGTIQHLYLSEREARWYGPGHLQCAAIFARDEQTKGRAGEHLRAALGWLRWWSSLPKENRENYPVAIDDIAAGAEAILRINGLPKAAKWLCGWRPKSVIYHTIRQVASCLIKTDGSDALKRWVGRPLRGDLCLAVIEAFQLTDIPIPGALLKKATRVWHRFQALGFKVSEELFGAGIFLCEALAQRGTQSETILKLLNNFSPPAREYTSSLYGDQEKFVDLFLRSRVLKAILENVTVDMQIVYPQKLKNIPPEIEHKEKWKLEKERKEFDELYKPLLSAYELRARVLFRQIGDRKHKSLIETCLYNLEANYRLEYRHDSPQLLRLIALVLADAAVRVPKYSGSWLRKIEEACLKKRNAGAINLRLSLAERIIHRPTLHTEALRLAEGAHKQLIDAPLVASERVTNLIRCTRIADVVDDAAGRYYFKLAIEAASEIDEEAIPQLACLAELANIAAKDNPTLADPELAHSFARFIEACHFRMQGWDHFPWIQCLKGITYFDPASGFTVLSRWDGRAVTGIEEEILGVLQAAAERDFITASIAYALSVLSYFWDERFSHVTLSLLDRGARRGRNNRIPMQSLLREIVSDIKLYTPIDSRKHRAQVILRWADKNGLNNDENVQVLGELHRFLETLHVEGAGIRSPDNGGKVYEAVRARTADTKVDWDVIIGNRQFLQPSEIEQAIDAISQSETFRYGLIDELLDRIRTHCTPAQYVCQLEALLQIDSKKLSFHQLLESIKRRLTDWSFHPSVTQWKAEAPEKIVQRRFHTFTEHGHFSGYYLNDLAETFEVDKKSLTEICLSVFPEFLDRMSAESLYELAECSISTLPPGGARQILNWVLPRLSAKLKSDFGDGPWCQELAPPRPAGEVIAGFLWSALGHPDKRVRWRAAHAVRRMARLGHSEVIGALVKELENQNPLPFKIAGHPFYSLSARLWLFATLERIARETPDAIFPHAQRIAQEAINPKIPHALVRYFAKKAALTLLQKNPGLYSVAQAEGLAKVSVSPHQQIEDDKRLRYKSRSQKPDDLRFSFDSLDTLPYWYDRLGDIFGLSSYDVAKIAEAWICDRWGFTGAVWEIDPIRGRYDYGFTSNHNGSEPVVEDLQTYLEYHGMMCAADQLLREQPLVKNQWTENPWDDWLQRWNCTWEDSWLADRRDSTPLEPQFWTMHRTHEKTWKWEIASEDFDRALGLTDPLHKGFLVVDANQTRHYYEDYETLRISSALVSPHTAPALLRALQNAPDFHHYFPSEGHEQEIDEKDFVLKGWLKVVTSDWGGIDESDTLRNQLKNSVVLPGDAIAKWAGLTISSDGRSSWRLGEAEKLVSLFENWNDCPQTSHPSGFRSEGQRLWINIKELLRFLTEHKWCLIIDCLINRHSRRHDESIGEYIPGYGKLFLINPNGKVETLSRDYSLGESPR